MPMMTGLEAIKEIRALYSAINARIKNANLKQLTAETGTPKTGL
jgi:CheY-like chemotaxis protein